MLDKPEVLAAKQAFTPILCREITWAIYEDSRSFFNTRMHPDDFKQSHFAGKRVKWPHSLLDDIMCNVRYQRRIHRTNFPYAWKEQLTSNPFYQPQPTGPSPFVSGRHNAGYYNQFTVQLQVEPRGNIGDKLAHVHPRIKAAMFEYHQKFSGRVMIYRLLQAANLSMDGLPKINQLINQAT